MYVLLSHFSKLRYGIRVDPIQWVYILINQESSDCPTLMLTLCKELFTFTATIKLICILFPDHIVPVFLCIIIEKGLSVVSYLIYSLIGYYNNYCFRKLYLTTLVCLLI